MICIGFGTNERLTSKLIRWATRSKWSHVWIEYPSGVWGGRWAAHSWSKGVVKLPISSIHDSYSGIRSYDVRLGVDDLRGGFEWASRYIGHDYDYGVIWNCFLLTVWRATKWDCLYNIVHRNNSKLTCSEFVTGFIKAAGVAGTERLDPELTTPGELEEFCSGSDDFWVV